MTTWDTKDIVIVSVTIAGVVVNGCIVLINQLLSSRRFGREKVWDLRREMYGRVIYHIDRAADWFGGALQDQMPGDKEWIREIVVGWKAIEDAMKIHRENYIIFSAEFTKLVSKLPSDDMYREVGGPRSTEEVDRDLSAVQSIRDQLLKVARRELRI